jgi:hypothetical protein
VFGMPGFVVDFLSTSIALPEMAPMERGGFGDGRSCTQLAIRAEILWARGDSG